jgi:phosphinothricin acetyltransferase
MKITRMSEKDWLPVQGIYQQGIDTGQATFEDSPPASWKDWSEKFMPEFSLVCLEADRVVGWAAVSAVSSREIYRGVGEVSVYVAAHCRGEGIGKMLLDEVIRVSEQGGFWTLQAGIFPENQASIQLHLNSGFREVGRRKRIGKMNYGPWKGQWRDVILLERRSSVVGLA